MWNTHTHSLAQVVYILFLDSEDTEPQGGKRLTEGHQPWESIPLSSGSKMHHALYHPLAPSPRKL